MMQNILSKPFQTLYGTAPFSKIKNNHFLPAFKLAIQEAKNEIDSIVSNPDEPTFQNTIDREIEATSLKRCRFLAN